MLRPLIKGGSIGSFERQGADGADFDAFATLSASGFDKGFVLKGRHNSLESATCKAYGTDTQLLLAYPNTFTTKDTLIGIEREDGKAVIVGKVSFEPSESL